ncbi:hypothetical protein ACHHV8_00410 [Paenibacillus sp. TAB 01]|uniref:hypothetical protein n=1 Tax=Paenibacillus sp. TAB 01 TaxID=3368988 RepID=UPI0037536203
MQYIIFGVIAIVGLIFLIIYNLRADAKSRKAQAVKTDAPAPEVPVTEESVQEMASDDARVLVEDARKHGNLVKDAHPSKRTADKTSDYEYREALRTFQSVQETEHSSAAAAEDEDLELPAPPPPQKADDQFRDALRSLKK